MCVAIASESERSFVDADVAGAFESLVAIVGAVGAGVPIVAIACIVGFAMGDLSVDWIMVVMVL